MKKPNWATVILILVFLVGLSLLLYPAVSDYWNSMHQSRTIMSYAESVAKIDEDSYNSIWEEARAYNRRLAEGGIRWTLTDEERAEYESLLDVTGTGVMGYIEIPRISCRLPVSHGTSEGVLQTSAGHVEGTSLPVGGENTHTVLSGHRGLPSAKLFTNLDKLVVGDTFLLHILDETLTYEVDRILIVEPYDLSALTIEEGQDQCTLVTCTPYGINTHRLLVRGHRVDTVTARGVRVTADAVQIEPVIVAPMVAAPLLLALLVLLLASTGKRRQQPHPMRAAMPHGCPRRPSRYD